MTGASLAYSWHESPLGRLLLAGDEASLHYLSFASGPKAFGPRHDWTYRPAAFPDAKAQLSEYFAGVRRSFDLALTFHGTAFQQSVWRALLTIPFGETMTYGEIAGRLGAPKASRAVGAANGANPLPIIAPCHRLLGSTGSLRGFGGGLAAKEFLLALEGAQPAR